MTKRSLVTPLSEEIPVITPLTHWHLSAEEACAEAEGVGKTKDHPTRTKFSVEGCECSEFR